jgi:hypothetical protein
MGLLDRVKALVSTPGSEWLVIAGEAGAARIVRYVAVLALIPALARCIGASLVGGFAPIASSLIGAAISYLASFAIVCMVAVIINALAPAFGGQRNFTAALKLAAYSSTPVWLAGIFLVIPGLSFLLILGLQGAYLLWAGLPILLQVPAGKTLPLAAMAVGLALIIGTGFSALEAPLFGAPG